MIKIEQTGSPVRCHRRRREVEPTLIGLGLNRIGRVALVPDTPSSRGMIAKVHHIVRVVETNSMPELDDHIFFSSASQYYVAGRFAVFAALNPVAANLMHHAIEMYLKGYLIKSKAKTLDEVKKLNHSLLECWAAFKAQVGDSALDKFDDVISEIHKYEEVRYPRKDFKGMESTLDIVRWTPPPKPPGTPATMVPKYKLCLPDVDELIAAILAAASVNPDAYLTFLKSEANEYVVRDNGEATLTKGAASALLAMAEAKKAPAPAPNDDNA
jgi:ribosomal protein L30